MRYQTISLCVLALTLATVARSRAAHPEMEYKAADQNYYLRASVLKAEPSAVILNPGQFRQAGDSWYIMPQHKAPREVYVPVTRDWLEPITPPSMPASLDIAPDAMQIRHAQGDVQVALPDNPANFVPALEGMPIPNGTMVKTGANGTAAVLFGGIDSARLAPGSQALVQQTVVPEMRTTRIDLKSGVVFSKVGLRPGEKQDYQVNTPFGVAAARGTDFVCVTLPDRTDVWVAQGTVRFDQPDGKMVGMVKAEGKGTLKIIRYPVIANAHDAMMATAQTMTLAMNFIPMVNVNVKTLHDQVSQGVKMTPQEKKYMTFLRKVTCLVKLTLVAPPAPPPAPTPIPPPAPAPKAAPVTDAPSLRVLPVPETESSPSAPATEPAVPTPASVPPLPATPDTANIPVARPAPPEGEITLNVRPNGRVDFKGKRLKPKELEAALETISPETPILLRGAGTPRVRMQAVLDACQEAGMKNVSFAPEWNSPGAMTPKSGMAMTPRFETSPAPAKKEIPAANETPAAPEKPAGPPAANNAAVPGGAPISAGPNDTAP